MMRKKAASPKVNSKKKAASPKVNSKKKAASPQGSEAASSKDDSWPVQASESGSHSNVNQPP